MEQKGIGLSKTSSPSVPLLGYTDTVTVKLDLDNLPFQTVKHWAIWVIEQFDLEGALILKTSRNHYHAIFNRTVSWTENVRIMAFTCLASKIQSLNKWFLLQCIKRESTLRVSPKHSKPSPRIVYRQGNQNVEIRNYLRGRRYIKRCWEQIARQIQDIEVQGGEKH